MRHSQIPPPDLQVYPNLFPALSIPFCHIKPGIPLLIPPRPYLYLCLLSHLLLLSQERHTINSSFVPLYKSTTSSQLVPSPYHLNIFQSLLSQRQNKQKSLFLVLFCVLFPSSSPPAEQSLELSVLHVISPGLSHAAAASK